MAYTTGYGSMDKLLYRLNSRLIDDCYGWGCVGAWVRSSQRGSGSTKNNKTKQKNQLIFHVLIGGQCPIGSPVYATEASSARHHQVVQVNKISDWKKTNYRKQICYHAYVMVNKNYQSVGSAIPCAILHGCILVYRHMAGCIIVLYTLKS